MNSGSKANNNGNGLMDIIEDVLQRQGFKRIEAALLYKNREYLRDGGRYYAREVYVGEAFFKGKKRIADVLIVADIFPEDLIIECKWQEAPGSTEEKFLYLVSCIKKTGIPTIVILDGKGYTPGAEEYLKEEVDNHVILAIWEISEFLKAVNAGYFESGILSPSEKKSYEKVNPYQPYSLWDKKKESV